MKPRLFAWLAAAVVVALVVGAALYVSRPRAALAELDGGK